MIPITTLHEHILQFRLMKLLCICYQQSLQLVRDYYGQQFCILRRKLIRGCSAKIINTLLTLVKLKETNVCNPAGTLSPKSCINGISSCWCRRSFSPPTLCGPFMYSYSSTFNNSCSPCLTPTEPKHCLQSRRL